MANPKPVQTDAFKAQQLPKYGARPLAQVLGTRYQQEVDAVLRSLPSSECQALIREAVEKELKNRGLLSRQCSDSLIEDSVNRSPMP